MRCEEAECSTFPILTRECQRSDNNYKTMLISNLIQTHMHFNILNTQSWGEFTAEEYSLYISAVQILHDLSAPSTSCSTCAMTVRILMWKSDINFGNVGKFVPRYFSSPSMPYSFHLTVSHILVWASIQDSFSRWVTLKHWGRNPQVFAYVRGGAL